MIQELKVKNYQSHKETSLTLHSGVNVIVGNPQNGKSALLRSLVWLKDNRPLGFRFNSWFSGNEPTEVEVRVDNISIVKKKTKSKTTYKIAEKDLDYKEGKGTPDEIVKLLNLSELNVQDQLHPFFLILDSPPEIARTFNRITKVEKADKWVSKLSTLINSNSHEAEILKKEIDHIDLEVKSLPDIKHVKKEYKKIKALAGVLNDMEEEREKLSLATKNIIELEELLANFPDLDKLDKNYNTAKLMVEDMSAIDRKREKLSSVIRNIKETGETLQTRFNNMPDIDDKLLSTRESIRRVNVVREELRRTCDAIDNIVNTLEKLNVSKTDNEEAEIAYKKYLNEIGKCPICYSDIDEKQIDKMVEV